jgi:hypothetical protein
MSQEQNSAQANREGVAGTTPPAAPSLPDINAETYPFEMVQHLIDQAAYFNMFSIPDPENADREIRDTLNGQEIIGIRMSEVLHRFNINLELPSLEQSARAVNIVGEPIGRFSGRWVIIPDDFAAQPGREPPPTRFDPLRSQRFVMLDGIYTVNGEADGFCGFGTGVTYPTIVQGQSQLLAAAVGDILDGFGRFKGHEGTYTYCGTFDPHRGFCGNLMCRLPDPNGDLRTQSDPPALGPVTRADSSLTYMMFRGQKKDGTQKTVYSFTPDGRLQGFKVKQQLRILDLDLSFHLHRGLRSAMKAGQVIGSMTSQVFLNILNPGAPGTTVAPIPFHTYNEYALTDGKGRVIGTFVAEGGEGRSFNMKLPAAPRQVALRFGAFQRLTKGTGCFTGLEGLLTDNSVVGVSPHATSTLYVLCINDPEGKYRDRGVGSPRPVNPATRTAEAYDVLIESIEKQTDVLLGWRRGFRNCSEKFSATIADAFNRFRELGDFESIGCDAGALNRAFQREVQRPFEEEHFNRFQGPAQGAFHAYDIATGREVNKSVLFSVWDETLQSGDQYVQKITGSDLGYYQTANLPPLSEQKVDLTVNVFRDDVGITGWVSKYQHSQEELTAVAYEISQHELLWMNKWVTRDGKAVDDDIFLLSLEWLGTYGGRPRYFIIGLSFEIDFDGCRISLIEDKVGKAHYTAAL